MREITHCRRGPEAKAALRGGFESPGSDSGAVSGNSGLVIVFVGNYGGAEGRLAGPKRKFSGLFVHGGAFAISGVRSSVRLLARPEIILRREVPPMPGCGILSAFSKMNLLHCFQSKKSRKREADAVYYRFLLAR